MVTSDRSRREIRTSTTSLFPGCEDKIIAVAGTDPETSRPGTNGDPMSITCCSASAFILHKTAYDLPVIVFEKQR